MSVCVCVCAFICASECVTEKRGERESKHAGICMRSCTKHAWTKQRAVTLAVDHCINISHILILLVYFVLFYTLSFPFTGVETGVGGGGQRRERAGVSVCMPM